MFRIDGITDEPKQSYRLPVVGSEIEAVMNLEWRDTQNAWFMSVSYQSFSVKNIKVSMMPNLLAQFANRIPFGLMCTSTNKQDPFALQSFRDKISSLYILTSAEVNDLESLYG